MLGPSTPGWPPPSHSGAPCAVIEPASSISASRLCSSWARRPLPLRASDSTRYPSSPAARAARPTPCFPRSLRREPTAAFGSRASRRHGRRRRGQFSPRAVGIRRCRLERLRAASTPEWGERRGHRHAPIESRSLQHASREFRRWSGEDACRAVEAGGRRVARDRASASSGLWDWHRERRRRNGRRGHDPIRHSCWPVAQGSR